MDLLSPAAQGNTHAPPVAASSTSEQLFGRILWDAVAHPYGEYTASTRRRREASAVFAPFTVGGR